jgi:benzoyl-CoA reductase subunit B
MTLAIDLKRYPTESFKCWGKAKDIRSRYYQRFADTENYPGLRWVGSAWTADAIPAGLGDDLYLLTSEPYGASLAFNSSLNRRMQEEAESRNWAHDLCAYMRSYWGSMYLDEYLVGDELVPWPHVDFIWQMQICCSHSKWYQTVSEYKGVPQYYFDIGVGPYDLRKAATAEGMEASKLQYVVNQWLTGIEFLEETTGRTFDDEKMYRAMEHEFRSTSLWAEICTLNKAVPAPLDEKSMYAFYALGTLNKASKEVADFYEELRDEMKDRVARGIGSLATERSRVISDSQPPWGFLSVYRYMEKFGVVSVGSMYTFGLEGIFQEEPDGTLKERITPMDRGVRLTSRERALTVYADWYLSKPMYQIFYGSKIKSEFMKKIIEQWKIDGVLIHLNRGCEGTVIGSMENRLAIAETGVPVMTYEGNMGDEREFDMGRVMSRIDSFMETLGLELVSE